MSTLALELCGVVKKYRHFLLDGINLELPTGSIMGLIGANGAGKSTTIRILMGLIHQDAGQVRVLDKPMPEQQIPIKAQVGFVSEDMRLYGQATLEWHMRFVRSIYPGWDQKYAEDLMQRFELKPRQHLRRFSHGQRVKAALLLVLARRPRLLILDEPTTGLDPVARHEVLGALMEVLAQEDHTVLFSSHNTRDVEQISDQITFMDQGRIIDTDDRESFLERWRRLRIDVPPGVELPTLQGTVDVRGSGQTAVVTTSRFDSSCTSLLHSAGAVVRAIEPLTLEEIFVESVQHRRARQMS
ncbi:ABC transporter ATP-binding protein [Deinococcus cellulosilyticus]|uniref:ABC transporter n=1 Tax=Deinococcus cellulosilyticus (strain DSM 18568 / NBRC 106333 / KACC 11606 / 5516J-15) TaxID=1223518 RepID=A0A511MZM9_DEIC1|nr:ABC transporter ATP-binding protein [Deinococcus cellulosilyticus]GEM46002.1 ABC transporter [Deinococcus cellulosilyticus NBRC 106333 = KACC 11606]